MKVIKTIIQYILTMILTLTILIYFFIILFSNTILKKEYILNKMEETNYYSNIYENAKINFENYIEPSGFELEILENILTEEKVKNDTNIIIDNIYDGTNTEISVQDIKDKINDNILKELEDKELNTTQQEAIDIFIDYICSEYTKTISHSNYEAKIHQIYQKVIEYVNIVKNISNICIILDIFILFMINFKRISKCISAIGIALNGAGILLLVTNFFINTQLNLNTIVILNYEISIILRNILTEISNKINISGLCMLFGGIILIFFSQLKYNIKKAKNVIKGDKFEKWKKLI